MRVLVTGGSGRLGRSTAAVLAARGHETVSADGRPGPAAPGVQRRTADLLDAEARGALFRETAPEAVVHLAGIAVPFAEPDERTLSVNAALAWSVLSEAAAAGARSAVAASSPTVYGYNHPSWAPLRLPLDEEHPGTAPFTGALADGRAVFSSERARSELGWRPEGTWRSRLRAGD